MADENGRPTAKLTERLLREGRRFSFIQAFRFLLLHLRRDSKTDIDIDELVKKIRVRPELSLAFPESDITKIEESTPPGSFMVTAAFLGLYGSSSPLPTFYTEDLLQELASDRSISRDFYDIFNSRLYSLYFGIWKHYHLFFNIAEDPDKDVLQRLYCLAGLGGEALRESAENPYGMLRYIGLATQFPRSAEGLRALLADGLSEPAIHITQCRERIANIPEDQRLFLGVSGNILGEDTYLGEGIADRAGNFRVHIGPVNKETFHRYLPGQTDFQKIGQLIRFYLDQPLAWDVEVAMLPQDLTTTIVSSQAMLGCNTWIFSEGAIPMDGCALFQGSGRN
ncbi:MAG: type VI secretion system baseplate subunit TssG [Syntrophales bacterium]